MGARKNLGKPFKKGKSNPRWNGGKRIKNGYIFIRCIEHSFSNSKGYVREHRLVYEDHLRKTNPDHPALIEIDGKFYLRPEWVVHHNNGIRDDNRIENLKLFENNEEHKKYEAEKERQKVANKSS